MRIVYQNEKSSLSSDWESRCTVYELVIELSSNKYLANRVEIYEGYYEHQESVSKIFDNKIAAMNYLAKNM